MSAEQDSRSEFNEQGILDRDLGRVLWFFASLTVLGMIVLVLHVRSWQATAFGLWALACLIAGAALGFIFAIPRSSQQEATPTRSRATDSPSKGREADVSQDTTSRTSSGQRQLVNQNLVEISDWLTKILVGVGLIQFKSIPPYAKGLAGLVAGQTDEVSFALALIIYFSTLGFLFGYLSTRLFISGAFSRAERDPKVDEGRPGAGFGERETLQKELAKLTKDAG